MSSFAPPRFRHRSTSRLHHWEPIRRGHGFRAFIVLVIALVGFGMVLYRAGDRLGDVVGPKLHELEASSSPYPLCFRELLPGIAPARADVFALPHACRSYTFFSRAARARNLSHCAARGSRSATPAQWPSSARAGRRRLEEREKTDRIRCRREDLWRASPDNRRTPTNRALDRQP